MNCIDTVIFRMKQYDTALELIAQRMHSDVEMALVSVGKKSVIPELIALMEVMKIGLCVVEAKITQ